MFNVHIFVNGEMFSRRQLEHLPRNGDTLRYPGKLGPTYVKVTEVIWCMDEIDSGVTRVNLRTETL